MIEVSKFPNELELKLLEGVKKLLTDNNVKFKIFNSPHPKEHNRGTKIFVNQNFTKISFHIYNVSDLQ